MPIQLKPTNGTKIVQKLGISQPLYDWMTQAGVNVTYETDGLVFKHEPSAWNWTVKLSITELSKLQVDQLHVTVKAKLAGMVTEALKDLQVQLGEAPKQKVVGTLDKLMAASNKKAATTPTGLGFQPVIENLYAATKSDIEELAKKAQETGEPQVSATQAKTKEIAVPESKTWPNYPADKMKSGPLVPLALADRMYQPTKGTSAGSRYYAVALSDALNVSARYNGGKLSVRVEPVGEGSLIPWKDALELVGFNVDTKYASVHMACTNDVIARKALGAAIMGIGFPFSSPMPLIDVLKAA